MASKQMSMMMMVVVVIFSAAVSLSFLAQASEDAELTVDFIGAGGATISAETFTFRGLANAQLNSRFTLLNQATVTAANVAAPANFSVLNGLGVSAALIQFPAGTTNPPHLHPRGSEILYLLEGSLKVGLIDSVASTPNLFTQTLKPGEIFVFPRGLVHFQINPDRYQPAKALAAFSSSNAGLVRLPNGLFNSIPAIDVEVLTKSFQVDSGTITVLLNAALP